MGWELKPLRARNLAAAVSLAKHYRDLNQPEEAESICRDILAVAPDNDDALRTLGLALTDQFPSSWMTLFDEASAVFAKLSLEFERIYYVGIAWERYAKAQLSQGRVENAIHAFEEAIQRFEAADKLASPDDPAPILHYNRCVRALTTHPEIVRASLAPPGRPYELGD
jgi:tetratricopeptide (TPR) repeat protein